MAKYITPIQPLVLTVADQKPTIPDPATIMPTDSRFNKQSDLMVGQFAYNVVDDIWYYRSSSAIKKLTGSTVLDVNDVEVWRNDKIYQAGNTFVSYVNESSGDPQFQTAAIYRCIVITSAGESPESAPSKWELQGATVDNSQISFLDLIDTPTTYSGLANKFVAINETEDGLTFIDAPESETITLDTVEVYDDTVAYTAGNTFVSYVNPGSTEEQFQVEAIYRCSVDTIAGESPEDTPSKWIYQGEQVEISSGNTSNTIVESLQQLKNITGYDNTDSVFVKLEKAWYKFSTSDETGILANDYDSVDNPGSWVRNTNLVAGDQYITNGFWYNHEAVADARGFANGDWRVPTNSDWDTFVSYVGADLGVLKEPDVWESYGFTGGDNEYGFSAYPSGYSGGEGYTNFPGIFPTSCVLRSLPESTSNYLRIIPFWSNSNLNPFHLQGNSLTWASAVRLVRDATVEEQSLDDGTALVNYTGNDGQEYKTVKIGTQVWTSENSIETEYANGDPISLVEDSTTWYADTTPKYMYPGNDIDNVYSSQAPGLLHPIALSGDYEDLINKPINSIGYWEVQTGDEILRPKENLSGERRKILEQDIILDVTAGFSFTGIDSFKHIFGKKIEFDSVIKDAEITDLRVGINGSTPTTISFPFTVLSTDVVEFAATYDRESDSYFTLIGKNIE